jgi:signal peptidase I
MSSIPAQISRSESNNHLDAALRIGSVGQRTRPRTREWLKRSLIALAGLLGVIAILVTIAPFFGWTVVRLATGSMTPTFPTDSLLVTHTVPATDAAVGDVVLVQRAGELPITHRVVSIRHAAAGVTALTLKGDANRTADAHPYLVSTVGLVVAGVPWGGTEVAALRSTPGLAGLTIFATLIVLWAWWPKKPQPRSSAVSDGFGTEGT